MNSMKTNQRHFPEDLFAYKGKEIEDFLQKAIRQALMLHKAAGNPIAVWKDGKVELISPENIKL